MWYIDTMGYSQPLKRNEMMPFAATWTDLEIIIQNEVRKRQHHMLSLVCGI